MRWLDGGEGAGLKDLFNFYYCRLPCILHILAAV